MPAPLPIVLLPGLHGTAALLAPLAGHLSAMRPVSPVTFPADEPSGYDALIDFVVQRLPPGRFVILGESFSGPLAIRIAAREKDRVAGLILASSFARHPFPRTLAFLARIDGRRFMPRTIVEAILLDRRATPELRQAIWAEAAKMPQAVLRARIRAVLTVDARRHLAETQCPVLDLRGRRDRIARARHAKEIRVLRPDARVEFFDAPHMLLETHPRESAAAVERFCARLDG